RLGGAEIDEEAGFELVRVVAREKAVRVAGVAVGAPELAAAVRVDRPLKRQARAVGPVEDLARQQVQILDAGAPSQRLGGRVGPAEQRQFGEFLEEGQGRGRPDYAFFTPST